MTTKSAAAMLPKRLPILSPPSPSKGVSIFAAAKKFTVPPMYEAQRHPAKIADATCGDVVNVGVIGNLINENDAMHPTMEPMLPMKNGSVMPCKHCFVVLALSSIENSSLSVAFDEDESKANTNDAGRNTLQHQSYNTCSVGNLGIQLTIDEMFESNAADSSVMTWPPPDLDMNFSKTMPKRVGSRSVIPAAMLFAAYEVIGRMEGAVNSLDVGVLHML